MRQLTKCSLEEIGKQVGNRDHSTVLNSLRRATHELEGDVSLRRTVEAINASLRHTNS
jgi:chromosomal replication initiation ATPase DnaA